MAIPNFKDYFYAAQVQQVAQHVSQKQHEKKDQLTVSTAMSVMMVQVDVMCCKSVGTDLSMLDIDDLMTEICQLKKEVKLLETKLRERDQLNRKDVCGVSLCDQTSPDLLLSVCNEEQKTSVKLLDCEMELKTQIKEEQTDEDDVFYSDLMEVKEEKPHHLIIGEESLSCLNTEQNFSPKMSQIAATDKKVSCTCPQCGKIFTRKSKLNRHIKIHTGERPYRCDQCGMTFSRNFHLQRHMKIHTGERSYKCDQCGRTFTRKDHLNDHMRLHNGEKPYRCDQCGMTFSRNFHLQRHMKIHTGERSYKCDQCGRTFTRKDHLNDHMRLHNGEKPYRCDQCGKMFFYKAMLQAHMRRHTEEKSQNCSSCERSFKYSKCLETHRKKCCKVHPHETVWIRRSLRSSAVT
ncbi:zinc finger protein 184-like [Triplophysa rosa]|uniref:zinc finger protein 184-like n=1 Tax=Triplophysa rosa TaxID=992332 RepID=UPI002545F6F8|nr:zinc finger protein 184-like [Triplophysa rosa]